jgi:hypothetical protein
MKTYEEHVNQLELALEHMGGTHTFQDILDAIRDGHMQSFAEGNTWVVTQILDFPRKRILEIILVAGEMTEAEALYEKVLQFGRDTGCQLVRTFGRDGWAKQAKLNGWANGHRIFLKDL